MITIMNYIMFKHQKQKKQKQKKQKQNKQKTAIKKPKKYRKKNIPKAIREQCWIQVFGEKVNVIFIGVKMK